MVVQSLKKKKKKKINKSGAMLMVKRYVTSVHFVTQVYKDDTKKTQPVEMTENAYEISVTLGVVV
jgi:hypothetical protein